MPVPTLGTMTGRVDMLNYLTFVFCPALENRRLLHHELAATAGKLVALLKNLGKCVSKPKSVSWPANPAFDARVARNQERRTELAGKLVAVRDDAAACAELWKQHVAAEALIAGDAAVQQLDLVRAKGAMRMASGDIVKEGDEQKYMSTLAQVRNTLDSLIANFNAGEWRDLPIAEPSTFRKGYQELVPTHRFWKSAGGGIYFYVYECNQLDVHVHCSPFNGPPQAVTLKKWSENSTRRQFTHDEKLADYNRKISVDNAQENAWIFQAFQNFIVKKWARDNVTTPDTGRIDPPLPRHRPKAGV
jgi:hypothetical protein